MEERTPRSSIVARIFAVANRVGDGLFARADARARDRGWAVGRSRAGLRRSYRDPRFDLLRSCPHCAGSGQTARAGECARCFGTGRLVHDPRRRDAG
jgi:hypothetical protein